jgi:hypothetical protein
MWRPTSDWAGDFSGARGLDHGFIWMDERNGSLGCCCHLAFFSLQKRRKKRKSEEGNERFVCFCGKE